MSLAEKLRLTYSEFYHPRAQRITYEILAKTTKVCNDITEKITDAAIGGMSYITFNIGGMEGVDFKNIHERLIAHGLSICEFGDNLWIVSFLTRQQEKEYKAANYPLVTDLVEYREG